MSGLRDALVNGLTHYNFCYAGIHASGPSIALTEEVELVADAVLRVLAEHGDTQQVRERLLDALVDHKARGIARANGVKVVADDVIDDAVMPVVAEILAARDAAAEELHALKTVIRMQDKITFELLADLAAARQQLDQVRALHQPQKRWQHPDCEGSFASRQEALDWDDCDPDDLTFFTVCLVCGEIEMSNSEGERDYMEAMWPCATAKALGLDAPARAAGHDETGQ